MRKSSGIIEKKMKDLKLVMLSAAVLGLGVFGFSFEAQAAENKLEYSDKWRITHPCYTAGNGYYGVNDPFNMNSTKMWLMESTEYQKPVTGQGCNTSIYGRGLLYANISELKLASASGSRTAYENITNIIPNWEDISYLYSIRWSQILGEEDILYAPFKDGWVKKLDTSVSTPSWANLYEFSNSWGLVNVKAVNPGAGYQVGDILNVNGGTGGKIKVTYYSGSSMAITVESMGSGYTLGVKTTTGGSGSGATIKIEAGTVCRGFDSNNKLICLKNGESSGPYFAINIENQTATDISSSVKSATCRRDSYCTYGNGYFRYYPGGNFPLLGHGHSTASPSGNFAVGGDGAAYCAGAFRFNDCAFSQWPMTTPPYFDHMDWVMGGTDGYLIGDAMNDSSITSPALFKACVRQVFFNESTAQWGTVHNIYCENTASWWNLNGTLRNYNAGYLPKISKDKTKIVFTSTGGKYSYDDNQYNSIYAPWDTEGLYLIEVSSNPADINSDDRVNIKDIQICIKGIIDQNSIPSGQLQKCQAVALPEITVNIKDIQAIVHAIVNPS